ncbi:MAG: DNA polymerase III subunit delta [Oscillospiraceae bacterium]|nr:DNA polymerase III subunit delta [Oscillospiraceae bacterium]
MVITEDVLKSDIKQNKLVNFYYFYGKEAFLTKTYTERVREAFAPDLDEFNLIKFSGFPGIDLLEETVETLPVFAEKKVVQIHDLDAEKIDIDSFEKLLAIFSDIPEYCAVIISITGFTPAKKDKTKKLMSCVEKHGAVCEFDLMSRPKATELIVKKAARLNCKISRQNAEELYDLTLGSLTLIGCEIEKLAAYAGRDGEITRQAIDLLTPRLTETKVFNLATALTDKKSRDAFKILDDLFSQNTEPVIILSSLSGAFVDLYRARLGKDYRVQSAQVAADFNYPKNRAWLMNKAPLPMNYLENCISALYKADIKLKSAPLNGRFVIEKTMSEILVMK